MVRRWRWARPSFPTGNDYGFAGTNGKYYTDYQTLEEEQLAAKELSIEAASEGFVMLKNENGALPLEAGASVSLFGMHSVDLIPSTVGSAAGSTGANGIEESTLQMAMENAGFKVNPKLIDLYTRHQALGTTNNELPWSITPTPPSAPTTATMTPPSSSSPAPVRRASTSRRAMWKATPIPWITN